jgi:hypothetical protein
MHVSTAGVPFPEEWEGKDTTVHPIYVLAVQSHRVGK